MLVAWDEKKYNEAILKNSRFRAPVGLKQKRKNTDETVIYEEKKTKEVEKDVVLSVDVEKND